jgi:hypothetical protein
MNPARGIGLRNIGDYMSPWISRTRSQFNARPERQRRLCGKAVGEALAIPLLRTEVAVLLAGQRAACSGGSSRRIAHHGFGKAFQISAGYLGSRGDMADRSLGNV